MNTKTAEEMDDFEATLDQYIHAHIGLTLHAPITTPMDKGECKYMLRQMYSDYVTPLKKTIQELDVHVSELHIIYDLKKRIEELEAKQVKIFDPDKNNGWSFDYNLCSQIANNINQHENLCVGVEEVHEILLILKSLGILNHSTNGKQNPM